MSVMTRANNLAFYELLGDAALFNTDREKYFAVTADDVLKYSKKIFDENQFQYHFTITAKTDDRVKKAEKNYADKNGTTSY